MPGVEREYPGLFRDLQRKATNRDRHIVRTLYKLDIPDTLLQAVPLISGDDPRVHDGILEFGRKLGLALYYREFSEPVPPRGGISVRWYPNVQIDHGALPKEAMKLFQRPVPLMRSKVDLADQADQMVIQIGTAAQDPLRLLTFFAGFHPSLAIMGLLINDRANLKPHRASLESARVFAPFDCA